MNISIENLLNTVDYSGFVAFIQRDYFLVGKLFHQLTRVLLNFAMETLPINTGLGCLMQTLLDLLKGVLELPALQNRSFYTRAFLSSVNDPTALKNAAFQALAETGPDALICHWVSKQIKQLKSLRSQNQTLHLLKQFIRDFITLLRMSQLNLINSILFDNPANFNKNLFREIITENPKLISSEYKPGLILSKINQIKAKLLPCLSNLL